MLISKAYAQAVETATTTANVAANAPSATEAFIWNMGLVVVLVGLFYMLLIRPQQKRMKEHTEMLQGLKKGDKVVTGGGLVGKVEKIKDGDDEVLVDLGGGVKVTAIRSTIYNKNEVGMKAKPANDVKK